MGKLLTLSETAVRLNRAESTLRYWVLRGEAPDSFKVGRRRMFREEAIESWLKARESLEVA